MGVFVSQKHFSNTLLESFKPSVRNPSPPMVSGGVSVGPRRCEIAARCRLSICLCGVLKSTETGLHALKCLI